MTCFVLVRHGQTEWNRVERFRGRADIPLNATGLEQARLTAERIAARWTPTAIYASPLQRARQTAEAIGALTALAVQPHQGLLDIDFGQCQGLTSAEARGRWPDVVDAWYGHPALARFPGGERLADVRARGSAAIAELSLRHPGATVVLVGHTVANRAILLGILGLGDDALWRLGQDPCAINVFEAGERSYVLSCLNDTCHLDALRISPPASRP